MNLFRRKSVGLPEWSSGRWRQWADEVELERQDLRRKLSLEASPTYRGVGGYEFTDDHVLMRLDRMSQQARRMADLLDMHAGDKVAAEVIFRREVSRPDYVLMCETLKLAIREGLDR